MLRFHAADAMVLRPEQGADNRVGFFVPRTVPEQRPRGQSSARNQQGWDRRCSSRHQQRASAIGSAVDAAELRNRLKRPRAGSERAGKTWLA